MSQLLESLVDSRVTHDDLLRVEDLRVSVGHGRHEAVRGVSFSLGRGQTLGLVGESGSGKTLTCRSILGVLPPGCSVTGGTVHFGDQDISGFTRRQWDSIRGRNIGAVFQDPASYVNPSLTVGRQLSEVLRVKKKLGRRAARAEAIELLASMELRRPELVYDQYSYELSGGMLQRVLIAIAVSCDPDLLVADEATTALDVTVQADVLDLLQRLRVERGLSIVLVSHDLAVVSEVCDQVVIFYAGEIVESGPTQQVLTNPRHPYTRALLDVATVGNWERRTLRVIPGSPPPVGAAAQGCRFADRCALATDTCRTAPISLTEAHGRAARCIHEDVAA